jgi:hypothetical protein
MGTQPRFRGVMKRLGVLFAVITIACGVAWVVMIRMPGRSFLGPLPALSSDQVVLRDELAADVRKLAGEIGERNVSRYPQLLAAADFVVQSFSAAGLRVRREGYDLHGKRCENIEAEIPSTRDEIVVVGAHYDSVLGSPGANDNGSGVAVLLALARRFTGKPCLRTLRFVAFPNEEPLHFQTEQMGSWVYAKNCKTRGDNIVAMISLETIGYYSSTAGSQIYPVAGLGAIYPTTGNFIGFVGNIGSRKLLRRAIRTFRERAQFPSQGAALPAGVPGISWSDHWSFWQQGYRGLMVTDTAPFRYPHYHDSTDTPDKLDYDSMSRVVSGLAAVIDDMVNTERLSF